MKQAQELRKQAEQLRIKSRTLVVLHAWTLQIAARKLEEEAAAIEARVAQQKELTS